MKRARNRHESTPPRGMPGLMACIAVLTAALPGCDISSFYPGFDIPDVNLQDNPFDPPDDWAGNDDGTAAFTIERMEPVAGPASGGTRVLIEGRGFSHGSKVFFGAVEGVETIIESDTSIRTTSPGGIGYSETVDVFVVRPDAKKTVLRQGFLYQAETTVTSISPSAGPVSGGTPVIITGHGFAPGCNVVIDGRHALDVHRLDDSTVLALTPHGDPGPVEVLVISGGASGRLPGGFAYHSEPEVTGCSPGVMDRLGPDGDGVVTFLVKGSGLEATESVLLSSGYVTSVSVVGEGLEVQAVPGTGGPPGPLDVTVAGPWGTTRLPSCIAALDPQDIQSPDLKIWSVIPAAADGASGTVGTIHVTGLDTADPTSMGLTLGDSPATVVAVQDMTSISFIVPSGRPGTVDVTLRTPSKNTIAPKAFTFLAPASISGVSPAQCIPGVNTAATVVGTGLSAAVQVRIGPIQAVMTGPPSDGEIQIELPDLEAGAFDVSVLLADGRRLVSKAALSCATPKASVLAISPDRGSIAGGTFAWVTGRGLQPGTRIFLGNSEATILAGSDPGRIAIKTPAADQAGPVDVFAVTPDGIRERLPYTFNYFDPTSFLGGAWGRPVTGAVNVTVLDVYTDKPVPGAFVMLGSDPDTTLKGFTDARGMVTLSARGLSGPVMATASRIDYTTNSLIGTSAENITFFIEPLIREIPDTGNGGNGETVFPPTPGIITGQVTGIDKEFRAPHSSCRGIPLTDGPLCRPCQVDMDCGDDHFCVMSGITALTCSKRCQSNMDCPDLYACGSTGDEPHFCRPLKGRTEVRCATADSSTTRWAEKYGPGAVPDNNGFFAINSRLGDVAVACVGGYRNRIDGEFVPTLLGVKRHLQVSSATINSGNEVRLSIPLDRTLTTTMISAPGSASGTGNHSAAMSLRLGSDGYLNLWRPISTTDGRVFRFTGLPRDMTDPLSDSIFLIRTEATPPDSDSDPYSTVQPFQFVPERPTVTAINRLNAESLSDRYRLDVMATCFGNGSGIVIDAGGNTWEIDDQGTIQALPLIGGGDIRACAFAPDGQVLFAAGGSIVWTFDLLTHEQSPERIGARLMDLALIAIGQDGTVWVSDSKTILSRSHEGDWRELPLGKPIDLSAMAAGQGGMVAVGKRGTVVWADADTATVFDPVTDYDLLAVTMCPEHVFAVGQAGTILHGSDAAGMTLVPSTILDDLTTALIDRGLELVAGGTRGIIVRLSENTITTVRKPDNTSTVSTGLVPIGYADDQGYFNILGFDLNAVMTGPFAQIINFGNPPSRWLWQDRTIEWTISPFPDSSFFFMRIYTSGQTGRWTLTVDGKTRRVVLPDLAAASAMPIQAVKAGTAFIKAYAVNAGRFDIDNFDTTAMYSSQWSSWSTQMVTTLLANGL